MPAPNELMNRRFEKAKMGGYKTVEVDSFMAEIAGEFSRLSRENVDLKRKLENAEKRNREYEEQAASLSSALLNAQHLADNILKDARTKSELTLRDAEIKAERIVERAKEATAGEQEHFERIKAEVDRFRSGLLKMYKSHLELITEIPALSAEGGPASQEDTPREEQAPASAAEPEKPESPRQAAAEPPQQSDAEEEKAAAPAASPAEAEAAAQTQAETAAQAAPSAAPAEPEVRLKLKYNEQSGEYLPLDHIDRPEEGGPPRFGRRR